MDKQARPEIDPVAVIKIAGQNHQIHLPAHSQINQGNERPPGSATQAFYRGIARI